MVTIPDKNIRLPNLQEMATLPLSQVVFLNAQIQYFRDSRNDIQLPRRQSPGAKGKKSERLCHLPIVELHETQSRPSAWSQKRKQCAIVPKVLKCSDSVLKPDQSSQVRTRKALPLLQNRRWCLLNITYQNSTRKWKFLFAHSTSWTEGLMLSAIADQQLVPPNAGIANKQIISFQPAPQDSLTLRMIILKVGQWFWQGLSSDSGYEDLESRGTEFGGLQIGLCCCTLCVWEQLEWQSTIQLGTVLFLLQRYEVGAMVWSRIPFEYHGQLLLCTAGLPDKTFLVGIPHTGTNSTGTRGEYWGSSAELWIVNGQLFPQFSNSVTSYVCSKSDSDWH